MITQEYLKSILNYDCETGIFTWKINKSITKAGNIAGSIKKESYCVIKIHRKDYMAHRLAWLYVYGYFPTYIDHINGIRNDNKLSNLREVTSSQNSCNRKISIRNTSGVKGVTWHKQINKWQVVIGINGKNKYFGCFEDKEFAELVMIEARQKYHGIYARNI